MKKLSLILIKLYKKSISPFLPTSCRYYPTCADYSYEAIQKHGVFKGLSLTLNRLIRCNPIGKNGYDPVP
ncbi:MAG: membrane protein insertion efficiency factor YidD [Dehalococcoidia bacterium]|nr:membrane protein insertion efficiency factor YidD [Dehalococcoidia bacterium]